MLQAAARSIAETASAAETEALGGSLAARLRPGDVVLVSGELGAGKTTFVRGAARALGVRDPVTSPTFTIARRYAGRVPVAHLDLYRLEGLDGEEPELIEDELAVDHVAFVEWPERAGAVPVDERRIVAHVHLEHAGADRRRVTVESRLT